MKTRLDAELVRRELARSREAAADLIESRSVLVNGIPATKPATQVDAETSITLQGERDDFVSRGGHKLAGALDAFPDIRVEGVRALDAGASTGGFTDVLLRRGAREVVAVDVGYGQLAWELRQDPRVLILDRTNIRHLTGDVVGEPTGLVVSNIATNRWKARVCATVVGIPSQRRCMDVCRGSYVGYGRGLHECHDACNKYKAGLASRCLP